MKLYLKLIPVWALMTVFGASARAGEEDPPLFYPFTVKIGEQSDLLIANAFPCREDGVILKGDHAVAIFGPGADTLKLDATQTRKPLKPGPYLMNVVAHGATSRVVFTVADPKGKMKLPKLGDIVNFLKGDS